MGAIISDNRTLFFAKQRQHKLYIISIASIFNSPNFLTNLSKYIEINTLIVILSPTTE